MSEDSGCIIRRIESFCTGCKRNPKHISERLIIIKQCAEHQDSYPSKACREEVVLPGEGLHTRKTGTFEDKCYQCEANRTESKPPSSHGSSRRKRKSRHESPLSPTSIDHDDAAQTSKRRSPSGRIKETSLYEDDKSPGHHRRHHHHHHRRDRSSSYIEVRKEKTPEVHGDNGREGRKSRPRQSDPVQVPSPREGQFLHPGSPEGVFRKDKSLEKEYITPEEPRTIFTGEADKSRRNQSKETVSSSGSSVTGFMKFVDRAFGK